MLKKNVFMKGTAEMIVLGMLTRRGMYAYEMAKTLEGLTTKEMEIGQGTLYPLLYRLEDEGSISGKWVPGIGKRPRRLYTLTPKGRKELARQRSFWKGLSSLVSRIVLKSA